MNLTEKPEMTNWPETHYVYVEKVGPFQSTAMGAWNALLGLTSKISEHNKITGQMALYKAGPQVYRAGVSLSEAPRKLPEGLEYTKFKGGKYSRFVLKGPYSDLPEACGRVFDIVSKDNIQMRDDFCIENYVTDAKTTPASENVTEILIPAA